MIFLLLQGVLPASLYKVHDVEARELIEQCISHDPDDRPSALELLEHSFFDNVNAASSSSFTASLTHYPNTGDGPLSSVDDSSDGDSENDAFNNQEDGSDTDDSDAETINNGCADKVTVGAYKSTMGTEVSCDLMSCEMGKVEGTEVGFELCIVRTGNLHNRIKFTYDMAKDNVEDVVHNLEKTYDLNEEEKQQFRTLLYDEVGKAPSVVAPEPPTYDPASGRGSGSSIFTDGHTVVSSIWTDEADAAHESGLGGERSTLSSGRAELRTAQSHLDAEDHAPVSTASLECYPRGGTGLPSHKNAAPPGSAAPRAGGLAGQGQFADYVQGKQPTFGGDWDSSKVVNMGLHGPNRERDVHDSKPHRGYCEPFLPKWFENYDSFMEG